MIDRIPAEEAWKIIMQSEDGRRFAYKCYYERDVLNACRRFQASEEWQSVAEIIQKQVLPGKEALDIGAGNGIGSYGLARMGFKVTAIEPDPGGLVGYGALRAMVQATSLPIDSILALGEKLPFADDCFSLVYLRQVLHHASDLRQFVRETARVLKPGGALIATREHVVDDQESMAQFLHDHPIHRHTQGEGAFTLKEYLEAFKSCGLKLAQVLGPWDSVINHYPVSNERLRSVIELESQRRWGKLGIVVARTPGFERLFRLRRTFRDKTPGRRYSFVAIVRG